MSDHSGPQGGGFFADAIHAEEDVKNGTEMRENPNDEDPKCGGAGFAFVDDGVGGSDQGGHDRNGPKQNLQWQRHPRWRIGDDRQRSRMFGAPKKA